MEGDAKNFEINMNTPAFRNCKKLILTIKTELYSVCVKFFSLELENLKNCNIPKFVNEMINELIIPIAV